MQRRPALASVKVLFSDEYPERAPERRLTTAGAWSQRKVPAENFGGAGVCGGWDVSRLDLNKIAADAKKYAQMAS
jgi:hypothetical protein